MSVLPPAGPGCFLVIVIRDFPRGLFTLDVARAKHANATVFGSGGAIPPQGKMT